MPYHSKEAVNNDTVIKAARNVYEIFVNRRKPGPVFSTLSDHYFCHNQLSFNFVIFLYIYNDMSIDPPPLPFVNYDIETHITFTFTHILFIYI